MPIAGYCRPSSTATLDSGTIRSTSDRPTLLVPESSDLLQAAMFSLKVDSDSRQDVFFCVGEQLRWLEISLLTSIFCHRKHTCNIVKRDFCYRPRPIWQQRWRHPCNCSTSPLIIMLWNKHCRRGGQMASRNWREKVCAACRALIGHRTTRNMLIAIMVTDTTHYSNCVVFVFLTTMFRT